MSISPQRKKPVVPIILAGGVGARLWPVSHEAHPKPFIKLDDGQTLIQKAYLRAIGIGGVEEIVTVVNREFFFYTKDEYEKVSDGSVLYSFLLEPFGRSSSAAIALAAHYAKEKYGNDCVLLVLPADHLIDNQVAFVDAVLQAVALAKQDKLVTLGIQPASPKTEYGYIEADGQIVRRFVEKPSLELAEKYFSSGNYYWNSGIFCMSAGFILEEMNRLCPDIASATLECLKKAGHSEGAGWVQIEIGTQSFKTVRNISIDYAVFEKSDNVAVIPCDIGWSDIGSWVEFGELHSSDSAHNYVCGDTVLENVTNCIIHSESKLIAGLGLKDLIIADTRDALLVAHRERAQDVRKIVNKLKQKKNYQTIHHSWGTYTVLLEDAGFKLIRIEFKPNATLNLQPHNHKNKHWIVVGGIAKVTNGHEVLHLERNQSTYIPVDNKHRLENPGKETLTLIEVQYGDYLGEDDIL